MQKPLEQYPSQVQKVIQEARKVVEDKSPEEAQKIEALASLATLYFDRKVQLQKEVGNLQANLEVLLDSKPVETKEFLKFKNYLEVLLKNYERKLSEVYEINKKEGLPEGRIFWLEHEFAVLKMSLKHWAQEFLKNCEKAKPPEVDKNKPS